METSKREFWLDLATQHGDPCDFVSEGKPHELVSSTNIHVIEKSAYNKAIRALKKIDKMPTLLAAMKAAGKVLQELGEVE